VRRSVEATEADFEASLELYRDVLVVLYASVATSYVEVRSLQKRIRYAEANINAQAETLELVRARNRAGLVGDLDLREAELNLARTESFLPDLRQGLTAAINRIGVLVGEYPSALYDELREPQEIPLLPYQVLVGLPTDLVRQRPDLRQAERELAAQTARIGVATADLYPRLTLLGSFSFDASSSGDWFSAAAQSLSLGPQLRWNLFDGGSIRSNIRAQDALAEQALVRYEQAVLEAVEEVENALASYANESDRLDALRRSTTAALKAVELVKALYRLGLVDFQNVLDQERSLFEEQDNLAASEGRVTQNLIRVYRTLGGGW
jgi:NodT family efflux transporter outer membrane factor (OMF) lipoprotein